MPRTRSLLESWTAGHSALLIVIVVAVVYANALDGEFVYDDTRQVVRNPLIQDPDLWLRALASDVWAFQGDGRLVASNYWRPTFTFWNIVCFRLFGLDPLGWHAASQLLHLAVCLLALALLLRWKYSLASASAAALLFALHPVQVESVSWIAGSPGPLFALSMLGSMWFATRYRETGAPIDSFLMVLSYGLALGAKEVALLGPLIVYAAMLCREGETQTHAARARTALALLTGVAVSWFAARWLVLGAISRAPPEALDPLGAVTTVPLRVVFYLRELLLPFWVSINHSLPSVEQLGMWKFWLAALSSLGVLVLLATRARADPRSRLAVAMLVLPLLPALAATQLPADQLVQDRHLYLPLLGGLMLVLPWLEALAGTRRLLMLCGGVSLLFAALTIRYNGAWADELSLWSWARRYDDSAITALQLGVALDAAGHPERALPHFDASLARRETQRALLGRARVARVLRRHADAERDLHRALGLPRERQDAYATYQVYETLALVLREQRKFNAAVDTLEAARTDLPLYSAALTDKLAIVLYQFGRKEDALRELERVRVDASRQLLPESRDALRHLGLLYLESDRRSDGVAVLRDYLASTAAMPDPYTREMRARVAGLLGERRAGARD